MGALFAPAFRRNIVVSIILTLVGVLCADAHEGRAAGEQPMYHHSGLLKVNGTKLFYEVMGSGTPILVLHGGPGLDHSYFLPQITPLAQHFKLIFFDQRASGKSDAHVDSTTMSVKTFVADIDGVRRALHLGKVNLLGHSFGGLLAMRYALAHPDRLNSLILVNPTPATSAMRDSSETVIRRRISPTDSLAMARIRSSKEFKAGAPEAMVRFFRVFCRPLFADPRYADSLTLQFPPDYAARQKTIGYLYHDQTLRSYDLKEGLRNLRCRALVIGGEQDAIPHVALEAIHHALAGSRLVMLDHCGHYPFVEAPEAFEKAIEQFLR